MQPRVGPEECWESSDSTVNLGSKGCWEEETRGGGHENDKLQKYGYSTMPPHPRPGLLRWWGELDREKQEIRQWVWFSARFILLWVYWMASNAAAEAAGCPGAIKTIDKSLTSTGFGASQNHRCLRNRLKLLECGPFQLVPHSWKDYTISSQMKRFQQKT